MSAGGDSTVSIVKRSARFGKSAAFWVGVEGDIAGWGRSRKIGALPWTPCLKLGQPRALVRVVGEGDADTLSFESRVLHDEGFSARDGPRRPGSGGNRLPRSVRLHGILELNGCWNGHRLIVSIVQEIGLQGSDGTKGSEVDLDPVLIVGRSLTGPAKGWV